MKKTKTTLFRNLILSLVLLVTIFLVVLAWFSNMQKATASNLSVTTVTSKGLQVSFTDEDSKYTDKIVDNSQKNYPLVSSGDGQNFFIPLLNRSTGEALTPYQSKRTAEPKQDYYETDLWFRSDEKLDVNLRNDSKIFPKNINENKSTFGDFSKDYIAGAARVAFFNVDANGNETLNKIWIPNKNYELLENTSYTKIEKTSSSGGSFNPPNTDSWNLPGVDSNLYLWEAYRLDNNSPLKFSKVQMKKDGDNYYAVIDVYGGSQVDHMVYIGTENDSNNPPTGNFTNYSTVGTQERKQYSVYTDSGQQIVVTASFQGDFSAENRTWAKLYIDPDRKDLFFNEYNRYQVKVVWKPNDNRFLDVDDFIFYDENDDTHTKVGGGLEAAGIGTENYSLEYGSTIIITGGNDNSLYALSFDNNSLKSLSVGNVSDNISLYNSNCMFLVEKVDSTTNRYRLKHLPTGNYLSINDAGNIVLSDLTYATHDFTLSSGDNGPLLRSSNGYYINFDGSFTGTDSTDSSINIYQGSTYNVDPEGNEESNYTYITSGTSSPSKLDAGKYFTDISDAPTIASLSEIDQSGYYKAHIKVRIWAEGTDREAKTPLAGGIFNNLLMFEGQKTEETT